MPTGTDQPGATDRQLQEQVDEVRDYLVALRGGAPFLSGADGQLLLAWLRAGVPVPLILSVLDGVADRRRRKRVRSRLSLSACRRALDKAVAQGADLVQARGSGHAAGLALLELAEELAGQELPQEHLAAQAGLVARLLELGGSAQPLDELARQAVAAVTRFHQDCWQASAPRHAELRAQAEAELAALAGSVRGGAWQELVEEVARDLLRQEGPAVSARRVWDSLAR